MTRPACAREATPAEATPFDDHELEECRGVGIHNVILSPGSSSPAHQRFSVEKQREMASPEGRDEQPDSPCREKSTGARGRRRTSKDRHEPTAIGHTQGLAALDPPKSR